MKLPRISLKLPDLPKMVAISASIIVAALILFGALFFTLGKAADDAIAANAKLKNQITQSNKDLTQVADDNRFVNENQTKFEALIQGDRLVPHTRRTAVRQMQALALQEGLTALNYDFATVGDNSLAAVTSQVQPKPGQGQQATYRVSVETITVKVGAPTDGQIYRFVADLARDFPGSAVVQSLQLQRAPKITDEMLKSVSHGQDAGLVSGEMKFLWRTAQANEPEKK